MEPNSNYDWSRFVKRIPINTSIKTIYDAWTTRKGIESWFLCKARFTAAGGKPLEENEPISAKDTYEWLWYGWPDETVESGEILEANGSNYLQFVFGKEGIVSVQLLIEEGETMVELTQEGIPTDDLHKARLHVGCSIGWTFYLANLKSVLEGGLDLRNRNINLKEVINS